MGIQTVKAYMPEINEQACQEWTEQDRDMYYQLPSFVQQTQRKYFETWNSWGKVFTGTIPWKPNMGKTMQILMTEPSPHIRQHAIPSLVWDQPTVDVININESLETCYIYRKRFKSRKFDWEPSFVDFMSNHIAPTTQDMTKKQDRYNDLFLRSFAFYLSPNVFIFDHTVAGSSGLVQAPIAYGNEAGNAANSKTAVWLGARAAEIGQPGGISMLGLAKLSQIMSGSLRVPAFSGSNKPVANAGLDQTYVAKISAEAWDQFTFDPWLLQNKSIDLNIVTDRFKGKLWGKVVCDIEDLPLRMLRDGTFPAPETVEMNPDAYNYGRKAINPTYDTAPYEWGFMLGAEAYKKITIGPPPAPFSSASEGAAGMNWNGKIRISKKFINKCVDDEGNTISELNEEWGEKLQLLSQIVCGAAPITRENLVPFLFRRYRGAVAVS